MKSKFIQATPFLAMLLFAILAPASNWCIDSFGACYGTWIHQISRPLTQPLYNFSIPALLITAVVFFLPLAIFKSWLKFAAWFLPLAFIFIALTPVSSTRFGIDFFPYYRINAAHDAGVAFVVASLLFLGWQWWRSSRKLHA